MTEENVREFFEAIDQNEANEIERRFFKELVGENIFLPTVAAAIAFIICRISSSYEAEDAEFKKIEFIAAVTSIALETEKNKYSLN